ncbi:MAG: hypothetical protein NTY19_18000 [Planctomycetota bacterium]|nr:hypothetical protein [Planctomycetota bacterium]
MTRVRVIVDEGNGPNTATWDQFQRILGERPAEYLFLAEAHPGIPDVEILDKLLGPETILLTRDCVLHMRALACGFRSYTPNEHGQLTGRPLRGVHPPKSPQSVHRELQDDYRYRPANDLPSRLKAGLSDKQFKRYRTARRRIRSHFGSAAAMGQVALTVGAQDTSRGMLCGFVLHVAGNSGVSGLRASEGYCLPADGLSDPACAVMHALRDQFLLQLDQVTTQLFVIPPTVRDLCQRLLEPSAPAAPLDQALGKLLQGVRGLTVHPCAKGRFFDAMTRKLEQLRRGSSNEVTTLDFAQLTASLLGDGSDEVGSF